MEARRSVVVISEAFRAGESASQRLADGGFEIDWRQDLAHVAQSSELTASLQGAWAVIAGAESYPAEVLERTPTLRAIARPGVGTDAIDLEAASRLGIAVLVTRGANDESVADHTVALMLACCRELVELDRRTRSGLWRPGQLGRELFGSTVGIVGLGAVGKAVVRRLSGFRCRCIAVDPTPDRDFCDRYGVELGSLDEMLPQIDVLTVHVPLGPQTRGLLSARELGLLSPAALVINTSRGGIVDEAALLASLKSGRVAAAGLDVYEHEPLDAASELADLPNVTLTPHYAAFTREAVARMITGTVDNLLALGSGSLPAGCVNAAELASWPTDANASRVI